MEEIDKLVELWYTRTGDIPYAPGLDNLLQQGLLEENDCGGVVPTLKGIAVAAGTGTC